MRKVLPQQGQELRELRLEGSGSQRQIVIVPKSGECVRFSAQGDVKVATVGHVLVRSSSTDRAGARTTFSGDALTFQCAEVEFDGDEADWDKMWRRARTQSHPWWVESGAGPELELDWAMAASFVLVAKGAS